MVVINWHVPAANYLTKRKRTVPPAPPGDASRTPELKGSAQLYSARWLSVCYIAEMQRQIDLEVSNVG